MLCDVNAVNTLLFAHSGCRRGCSCCARRRRRRVLRRHLLHRCQTTQNAPLRSGTNAPSLDSRCTMPWNILMSPAHHLVLHLRAGMQVFVKTLTGKTITLS